MKSKPKSCSCENVNIDAQPCRMVRVYVSREKIDEPVTEEWIEEMLNHPDPSKRIYAVEDFDNNLDYPTERTFTFEIK